MSKLSDLILLILCVVLANEILASSDENNEFSSSAPHSRPERMNHNQNRILPREMPALPPPGLVDIEYPTKVAIVYERGPPRFGYAINSFHVVARKEDVLGKKFEIHIPLAADHTWSGEYEESGLFQNRYMDVALVRTDHPMYLDAPEHNALSAAGFLPEEINWAVGIVQKWAKKRNYPFELFVPRIEAGSPASASGSG